MYNLNELMEVKPVVGRRVRNNDAEEKEWLLPVEQLMVDDIVRVHAGERIPADGVIVKGSSMVSTQTVSHITPIFEKKTINSKVKAGTINAGSDIDIRVSADWQHSSFEQKLEQARSEHDNMGIWNRLCNHLNCNCKPSYDVE